MSEPSATNKDVVKKRQIRLTVAVVLAFIAAVLSLFIIGITRDQVLSESELKQRGVFLFEKARSFKTFTLLDDNGDAFTPAQLKGKWSLIFFGFTYCPDICPTTLALLNEFYQWQSEKGDFATDLQVVMVSVDPGRDDPEKLHQYVKYFNKSFIGVTGEFLDLHRFATQLNIPFSKVPGGGNDYLVEHSGNVAIINPGGHYIGFFKAPLDLSQLNTGYESIRLLGRY